MAAFADPIGGSFIRRNISAQSALSSFSRADISFRFGKGCGSILELLALSLVGIRNIKIGI